MGKYKTRGASQVGQALYIHVRGGAKQCFDGILLIVAMFNQHAAAGAKQGGAVVGYFPVEAKSVATIGQGKRGFEPQVAL